MGEGITLTLTSEQEELLAPLVRSAAEHRVGVLYLATVSSSCGTWLLKSLLLDQGQIKKLMKLLK
jgi:hypothetical protein